MKKALFLVVFGLVLASCGKDRPGNQDAYQTGSSDCSPKFVSEYNSLDKPVKVTELKTYRQSVMTFKSTYAGVRCDASVNGKRETVDASKEADRILGLIDQKLKN